MKEILPENIGIYVGKEIKIQHEGQIVKASVTISMGPMYFIVYKERLINHVYERVMQTPAKMYAL